MVRRRSRVRGWVPLIVLVAALAVAVVAVVAVVSANRPTVERAEDVAIYTPPLGGRQPDVITGELRREAGCTYLDGADGRRWLVLFPDLGTRWDDDALRVEYNRYPLAAELALRGRVVKLPVDGYDTDIPAACGGTDLYFFVRV